MLLWKAFKPEKVGLCTVCMQHVMQLAWYLQFCEVAREFVLVTLGGEYIKSKSPSWDEILAQTTPHVPTLLLQLSDSSLAPLTVAEIVAAAQHRSLLSSTFSLHRKEGYKELLESLPDAVSEDCWVIVEHSHLLPNYQEIVTELTRVTDASQTSSYIHSYTFFTSCLMQKLKTLEDHARLFRLLILMPAEYISKNPISGCRMIACQNLKVRQACHYPTAFT